MVDYRSRWQRRRRRKTQLRLAIIGGVLALVAIVILLVNVIGGPEVVWEYRPLLGGVPHLAVSGDNLFAAWSGGTMQTINVYTGMDTGLVDYRWPFAFAEGPALAKGMLVVGSNDCQIHGISTETGRPRWRYEAGGSVQARPTIDQGQVLVGADDGHLYCLDLLTGVLLWKVNCGGAIAGAAAVVGDVVVVGTAEGRLVAVDRGSGQRLWTLPTGAAILAPVVAVDGKIVTVGCDDGSQYIIDVNDYQSGRKIEVGGLLRLCPVADRQRLYVANNSGQIVAATVGTGEVLWRRRVGQTLTSGLAADDEYLYTGTLSGYIYALHQSSGRVRRRWQVDQPVTGSLVVAGDLLIAGLSDGRVVALHAPK